VPGGGARSLAFGLSHPAKGIGRRVRTLVGSKDGIDRHIAARHIDDKLGKIVVGALGLLSLDHWADCPLGRRAVKAAA